MDQAGRILEIPADLARRLGLFGDVRGFSGALLFQLSDSSFVLEVTSVADGRLRRERRPLTPAAAALFREDIAARVASRAPSAVLDQGGRTKLLVGSTILGLGYYGWATANAFDPDDTQGAVAIYMVTAAGSFIVPYFFTRSRTVPDAVATLSLWGAMRGPLHGWITADLGTAPSDKTRFGWSVSLGAAEAIAGGLTAHALRLTTGHAEIIGATGDIALGAGFALADILKLDERFDSVTVSDPFSGTFSYPVKDRTLQSAVLLAASGLGLAGGYLLGTNGTWSRGDAWIFRNLAAIGGLGGVAVADVIQQPRTLTETPPGGSPYSYVDDGFSTVHSAGGLVGTAAGMVLGRALLRGRNFTTGQGTFLTLAPLAGGLLGLGIAYLATPEKAYDYDPSVPYRDPNDHSELYLGMSALGAAAGFAAMYPAMAKQAREQELGSRLGISLNPVALAQVAGGHTGRVFLGSVQYRF